MCDQLRSRVERRWVDEHDKLVAAQAPDRVAFADRVAEALADRPEHFIAGRVAEAVVDVLEAVDIDV